MSNDNQSIFDIMNLSNIFWKDRTAEPDDFNKSKRHYLCTESQDKIFCTRIYKNSSVDGKYISISEKCPEIFDTLSLSYRLGKKVNRQ
jgi:hypothetical protein